MLNLTDFDPWFAERGITLYAAIEVPQTQALETDFSAYENAIAKGFHAEMSFLATHASTRREPDAILAGARSAIIVAFPYGAVGSCDDPIAPRENDHALENLVAGFARWKNYHHTVKVALEDLGSRIAQTQGPDFRWRAIVDSAPFLEKAHGRLAGLGSTGKNTLLLTQAHGSAFVLGEILTTAEARPSCSRPASEPLPECGNCRRCIDVCPTGALVAPRVLDARRCRAYLTVEHRGPVDPEFIHTFSTTLFGCDACQRVCPYTRNALRRGSLPSPLFEQVDWRGFDAFAMATLSRRDFDRLWGDTSLSRARHDGMVRNALYHLFATGHPRLPEALDHWKTTASKNIRAVVEQIRERMSAERSPSAT